MNIFHAISSATTLFEQGKALNGATLLVNVEAGAAMLYGILSALVEFLTDLGLPVNVGGSDIHTIANGWSLTISVIYAIYRVATNPAAGVKPSA